MTVLLAGSLENKTEAHSKTKIGRYFFKHVRNLFKTTAAMVKLAQRYPCAEEGVQETAALACALVGRRGRQTRESVASAWATKTVALR